MTTPMKIKTYYDHAQATKDLRNFDADITIELMRQPGLYAYYASLLVQAEAQYDRLTNSVDILEARLDMGVRQEAAKTGDKCTEGQVKAKIKLDPRMSELKRLQREAKSEVGYLKGVCQALVQRKDSLMQMGYLARKEQEAGSGGMAVMKSSMEKLHQSRVNRLAETFAVDLEDDTTGLEA